MKQSKLCKICACERFELEKDGFVINDVTFANNTKCWFYLHPNGNRITIELNLNINVMRVFKNSLIIKEVR